MLYLLRRGISRDSGGGLRIHPHLEAFSKKTHQQGDNNKGDSAKEKGISVFFPGFKLIPNCDSHAIATRTPCPSLSFAQMPTDTTTQSGKRVGARV